MNTEHVKIPYRERIKDKDLPKKPGAYKALSFLVLAEDGSWRSGYNGSVLLTKDNFTPEENHFVACNVLVPAGSHLWLGYDGKVYYCAEEKHGPFILAETYE